MVSLQQCRTPGNHCFTFLFFVLGSCLSTDEPGSRSITDEWKVNWATYMASARDIIVAKIDAHGSQGMGDTIRNSIYRKPGVLEAIDLIHVTK